jgi:hypothetical protein
MTHINDPRAALMARLRKFSERLGLPGAANADQQMTEHVRALSELRHLVKACERESTKMAKIFEEEIRELRLANEMLRARGAPCPNFHLRKREPQEPSASTGC